MLAEIRTGIITSSDGAVNPGRADKTGAMLTSDAHGRYMEAVYRGNCYFAANQAAVTFSVGLTTTTAVGLILTNPTSSGKIVVPLQVEYANNSVIVGVVGISVQPYSATAVTQTTALTVRNAYVEGPYSNTGIGLASSGVTLALAPVAVKLLYSVLSTNTAVISQATVYDIGGSMILAPGTALAVLATAATTGLAGILWEEQPI